MEMGNLINDIIAVSDKIKSLASLLPLVWAIFIIIEWNYQNKYFYKYKIKHSFDADYKLAFNPVYVISLVATLLIVGVLFVFEKINGTVVLLLIGIGSVIPLIVYLSISLIFRKKLKTMQKQKNEKVIDTAFVSKYRNNVSKYRKSKYNTKVFFSISTISLIGSLISIRKIILFLTDCFPKIDIKIDIINSFIDIFAGFKPYAYVFWILLSAFLFHWVLHSSLVPYDLSIDYIEYFRVIIKDQKTYVLLAPINDKNTICVEVRTIICKMNNGMVYAYLIPDDVITKKAPFDGDFSLIDVDVVTCIPSKEMRTSFLNDKDLIEILSKNGVEKYWSYNKKWESIVSFWSGKDNRTTIVRQQ